MGVPCQAQDTEQRQGCNLQPCPGEYLGCRVPVLPSGATELRPLSQLEFARAGGGAWAAPSLVFHLTVCPPECLPGQVLRACATSCPYLCSHLQPGANCVQEPCQLGCGCPGEQVC